MVGRSARPEHTRERIDKIDGRSPSCWCSMRGSGGRENEWAVGCHIVDDNGRVARNMRVQMPADHPSQVIRIGHWYRCSNLL
jgi:hypothetical protein